jgi:hypothetical protein
LKNLVYLLGCYYLDFYNFYYVKYFFLNFNLFFKKSSCILKGSRRNFELRPGKKIVKIFDLENRVGGNEFEFFEMKIAYSSTCSLIYAG